MAEDEGGPGRDGLGDVGVAIATRPDAGDEAGAIDHFAGVFDKIGELVVGAVVGRWGWVGGTGRVVAPAVDEGV